ncbi:MAG: hypothetical protein M1815_004580 [Lichina confinis]|nr:MAG: hypothetical protein M1815_004580 [Lichina confinis]
MGRGQATVVRDEVKGGVDPYKYSIGDGASSGGGGGGGGGRAPRVGSAKSRQGIFGPFADPEAPRPKSIHFGADQAGSEQADADGPTAGLPLPYGNPTRGTIELDQVRGPSVANSRRAAFWVMVTRHLDPKVVAAWGILLHHAVRPTLRLARAVPRGKTPNGPCGPRRKKDV